MSKPPYYYVKEWKKRNKDKVAAYAKKYAKKHPEIIAAKSLRWRLRNIEKVRRLDAERQRNRRKKDPEGARRRSLAFRARREAKLTQIAGRSRPSDCDLCEMPIGNIVFDHCHASGEFRGWICDRCNKVLGLIKDDPNLLRLMAMYLENANGKVDNAGTKLVAVK